MIKWRRRHGSEHYNIFSLDGCRGWSTRMPATDILAIIVCDNSLGGKKSLLEELEFGGTIINGQVAFI